MAVPVSLRQRDMAAVVERGGDFSPLPAGEEKPRNAWKSFKFLLHRNQRNPRKEIPECLPVPLLNPLLS